MNLDFMMRHEDTITDLIQTKNDQVPAGYDATAFTFRNVRPGPGGALSTLVDVDLLLAPSEVYGDFVTFQYDRVPLEGVFVNLDAVVETADVEVVYAAADRDTIAGGVVNFKDIYDTWYRYSHSSAGKYPAIESELNSWRYIEEFDFIECTANTASFIGFMSSELVEDFTFNTVVTANHSDDDHIGIDLMSLQHGIDGERDHKLTLNFNTGGANGGWITLWENLQDANSQRISILDSTLPPPDPNNQWSRLAWSVKYGHVWAQRKGNVLEIWAKMADLPGHATASRDANILNAIRQVKDYTSDDFLQNGYKHFVWELPARWQRPCRYGYSAASQPFARYWNIQRPGENPGMTPDMKTYMETRFGINLGTWGITIQDAGSYNYKLTVDNMLYKGEVIFKPA